jgi:hypothetical protein
VASVRKRTIPTERPPLVSEVSANFFADRGCHVVRMTNPYGRIFGFLDRSRCCFFQVAPQLYSRDWVDPVPDPLLFSLVVPGDRTRDLRICSQELWPLDHRTGHYTERPTDRPPLVSEVSANFFADRGCHVVIMTNPYDRIFGFLDRSHFYFFQVAPQLYSRGWVDPIPDPLLFLLTKNINACIHYIVGY